eukprot:jgi/Botrbrau1/17665/Bobra.0166s0091.1
MRDICKRTPMFHHICSHIRLSTVAGDPATLDSLYLHAHPVLAARKKQAIVL